MQLEFFAGGGLTPFTGYGKMERAIYDTLLDNGIGVTLTHPPIHAALPLRALDTGEASPAVLMTTRPFMAGAFSWRKPVYLFTMSESTRVSPRWVANMNRFCRGVFVCAPALVEIYQASGVTVPVHFVPLGVDFTVPPPLATQRPRTRRFLTYTLNDSRKGVEFALFAFKRVFGDNPAYELVIKTPRVARSWLQGCQEPQVVPVEGGIGEWAWYSLLQSVDAFIFASRGEGFGLPPREAALAGTPALATHWLGMWDAERWGFPIRVKTLVPSQMLEEEANARDGLWAEPDLDDLCDKLAWVDNHLDDARQHAARGRRYLLEHFTWQRTVERIMEIIHAES